MITFDGDNLEIIITSLGTYDAEQELYSDWKEWFKTGDNSKYPIAFDTTGGDDIDDTTTISGFFFLRNDLGWRIKMPEADGQVIINGDLFPRDNTLSMFTPSTGSFNVFLRQVVSSKSLVNTAAGTITQSDLDNIADAVWDEDIVAAHTTADTAGYIMNRSRYIERQVFVDTDAVSNGNGSAGSPYDNIGDAIDFAEANSIKKIVVYAEITLDRNLKNFSIVGVGAPVINTNGQDLKGTEFSHCTMRGTYLNHIVVQESVLDDGFWLNGFFENSALNGDLTCVDGGTVLLTQCVSNIAGLSRPTISLNGIGSSKLSVRKYSGGLTLKDCNNAADEVTLGVTETKLTLENTCTAGIISVRGDAYFTDNSNGSTVDITALIHVPDIEFTKKKAALAAALSA